MKKNTEATSQSLKCENETMNRENICLQGKKERQSILKLVTYHVM